MTARRIAECCVVEAMRLNVTAATAHAIETSSISFANCSLTNDNNDAISATDDVAAALSTITTSTEPTSVSSHIIENGTLNGSIVTQPSVSIQVNQNSQPPNFSNCNSRPLSSDQQSNCVNQLSGVISIVNCYRAVPVHVVNNNGSNIQNNTKNSIGIGNISSNIDNNNGDGIANFDDHISNDNQINVSANANMSVKSEKCDIQCINEDDTNEKLGNRISSEFLNSSNHNSSGCNSENITSSTNNNGNSHVQRTYISTETQTGGVDVVKIGRVERSKNRPHPPNSLTDSSALIDFSPTIPGTTSVPTVASDTKTHHSRRSGSAADPDVQLSREQRRRERRERRQARNARQQHVHPNQSAALQSHHSNCEILPDILHSHVPPPYTTLPMPTHCQINAAASVLTPSPSSPSGLLPGTPSAFIPVGISDDGRYTFPLPIMRR